jgi:hypothetical protein
MAPTETSPAQLSRLVDYDKPDEVMSEVRRTFEAWYPKGDFGLIERSFSRIKELFAGAFPGYRGCDTGYHDLHHTTDVLVAASRLMDGRALSGSPLPCRVAENLHLAAILHDTGYIREAGDASEGTGAKYTACHVARSEEFARRNAEAFGADRLRAESVAAIIECTNLRTAPAELEFKDKEEEAAGTILGTADILGQMADRAYLEKLLFLYYEFREAGFPGYHTEFDILRNTLAFYASTRDRLDGALSGAYRWAEIHFRERCGGAGNLYVESIERQMEYLKSILADDSSNFRKKLKRIDLEKAGATRTA